jgi:polysaccharide export outer membrane protein
MCLAVLPITASAQMTAAAGGAAEASAAPAAAYRLRAGDAVRLLVRDEPELGGEYAVLEDGTVPLPLIGLVQVGGMAFGEVVERVRAAYAAELVDAMVVLQPLIRVRVLGEVRVPGLYLVDATFGLRDVLAQAGGAGPSAAPDRVVLMRGGAAVTYELESAAAQHVLQPGDEIVVPRRGWVRENMPILVGAGTSVLAAALTALLVR